MMGMKMLWVLEGGREGKPGQHQFLKERLGREWGSQLLSGHTWGGRQGEHEEGPRTAKGTLLPLPLVPPSPGLPHLAMPSSFTSGS